MLPSFYLENRKIDVESTILNFNINFQILINFFTKPALKQRTKVILTSSNLIVKRQSGSVNIVTKTALLYFIKIVTTIDLHSHYNMCDLAGSFTCFESFTIPYFLCIYLTIF